VLDRRVQRPDGLYSILPGPREQKYQYTLKYFLDPQKPHGFGYTLLEAFLECIDVPEFNLAGQHIEIEDEVWVANGDSDGRIDLIIAGGNALSDHPRWAVFLELKVGAAEGDQQTTTYAETKTWNFSWFKSSELDVDRLDDAHYVYVKRDLAEGPDDDTGTFDTVSWSEIAEWVEREVGDSLFDYPNRSVIQVTDFMQSLKETENMDSSIDEDELTERLNLYFEYSDLIQQVEQANSQFESDFENLSSYLKDNWETKLRQKYDFEGSGWTTSPSSNAKWQGILPEYWHQDPLDGDSTVKLWFRHSPTTDVLRNGTLTFRLRLPPQRNAHITPQGDDRSFNDVFTEKCTSKYREDLNDELAHLGVDTSRLDSASALIEKSYPLDSHDIAASYFDQLDTAVDEFCSTHPDFLELINEAFEDAYQEVFGEAPAGNFPGPLRARE
jgi:hypothetical protein